MPTPNMRALYRRLLVLAFLCASLIFFLSRPANDGALAAGCLENCEPQESMCVDACNDECASDDTSCSNCITQCSADRNWCNAHSYTCGSPTVSSNSRCAVDFGSHCVVDWAGFCDPSTIHNGYWQECTTIVGNQPCITCPFGEICGNSNLPRC